MFSCKYILTFLILGQWMLCYYVMYNDHEGEINSANTLKIPTTKRPTFLNNDLLNYNSIITERPLHQKQQEHLNNHKRGKQQVEKNREIQYIQGKKQQQPPQGLLDQQESQHHQKGPQPRLHERQQLQNKHQESKQQTQQTLNEQQLVKNYDHFGFKRGILFTYQHNQYMSYAELMTNNAISKPPTNETLAVTIQLILGLGNQMFSYASAYGIAKKNRRKLNFLGNLDTIFHISKSTVVSDYNKIIRNNVKISYVYCCKFNPMFEDLPPINNLVLSNYFQSWKFFDDYKDDIKKQYTFRNHINDVKNFLKNVRQDHIQKYHYKTVTLIGIHIRRNDMLKPENVKHGHKIADESYIKRAIKYYEDRFTNCVFVVCSDDLIWSKETLSNKTNVVYSKGHSADFDMQLLTKCDHLIITVGTFGWWSGYLNNGTVTYYKDWPKKNSGFASSINHEDYFPPHWIGL